MRTIILVLFLSFTSLVAAHPGHDHHQHVESKPITQEEAKVKSQKVVKSKVDQGKLQEHWLKIKPAKCYKKSFSHGPEWVVEFHDANAEDEKKKVLYVFLSLTGKVLGINFTGV